MSSSIHPRAGCGVGCWGYFGAVKTGLDDPGLETVPLRAIEQSGRSARRHAATQRLHSRLGRPRQAIYPLSHTESTDGRKEGGKAIKVKAEPPAAPRHVSIAGENFTPDPSIFPPPLALAPSLLYDFRSRLPRKDDDDDTINNQTQLVHGRGACGRAGVGLGGNS